MPPSTLSPLIWSFANVSVPADISNVLPEPTVISLVEIVVLSIVPPLISTVVNVLVPVIFNVGTVIFSLEFQPVALVHLNSLSVLPFNSKPPLSAVTSVGEATLPSITNLSST